MLYDSGYRKDESTSRHGIREHVDRYVRDEPGTLQCRHQGLLVYLRLQQVHRDEYGSYDRGKEHNPPVTPLGVGEDSGQHHEKEYHNLVSPSVRRGGR